MADDPFCYQLKSALAHLRGAINELNAAFAMPSFRLLHKDDRHRLRTARDNLSRKATVIKLILPLAVDATYVQAELPNCVHETLKIAEKIVEITKSDNAQPPGPE